MSRQSFLCKLDNQERTNKVNELIKWEVHYGR